MLFKIVRARKYMRRPHTISFRHAWDGIKFAMKSQPNFQFHILAFSFAMLLGFLLRISYVEFLSIILVSALVFTTEMLNTSLEALGDEVADGKFRDLIKVSKDVSAGGVLISAGFAVIVGLVIFVPRIVGLFAGLPR